VADCSNCIAWKGHEIVAVLLFDENDLVTPVAVAAINLFFVRVNQVLVRLWARVMEAGLGPVFVPLLRLMSDRESVSVVARPRFGFRARACAPKSDSECSEACV
jgi:hypothetical protein